ncbi:MAG: RraA family protein [Chloroflexota bacterium]
MTQSSGVAANRSADAGLADDERKALVDRYRGLRVTDVCDGMDRCGLQDVGLLDWEIRPLWRDTDQFRHRIYGFAHTVRFVPTMRRMPTGTPEEIDAAVSQWYRTLARGPIGDEIKAGDVIVIDAQGVPDTGFIGSNNALGWITRGAVGVVTNGGARDTDELIKQRVPVYARKISRGIRPGRLELDRTNVPVTVGGVYVRPGDLIVADGDGAICVPIERAQDVATWAWKVANGDKQGRRRLYEAAGLTLDETVEVRQGV